MNNYILYKLFLCILYVQKKFRFTVIVKVFGYKSIQNSNSSIYKKIKLWRNITFKLIDKIK